MAQDFTHSNNLPLPTNLKLYERTTTVKSDVLQVAQKIIRHIETHGGEFDRWYVGITSDLKLRLFSTHSVNNDNHWTYENARTQETAETIVKYIMEQYKTRGGFGGGDGSATYVYAYKITPRTIQ